MTLFRLIIRVESECFSYLEHLLSYCLKLKKESCKLLVVPC